ncbi:MAG: hypothetical protein K9N46_15640 [Candidatus Marinimicrobia bacterium]|nr:hypothetical protein [Candidatus Neomarinimicrobiota bacterium]MCF7830365.1 hypothetical protein [Candidatus Neomarinimicrobiota bacterium]MCF7882163.1 hypothetical protein [Candidatus Neomarinimicrobiota bacterium]
MSLIALPASGSAMPFMGMFAGHGSGGYVGPAFKLSGVQGEPGLWAGLRGGWRVDRAFSVGLSGYWLLNEVEQPNSGNANLGYGGVEFQAFFATESPVRIAVQTLIGAGSAGDGFHFGGHAFNTHDAGEDSDNFLVVEPGIALQMPLNSYVTWEIGATYLAMSGLTYGNLSGQDLGGLTGTMALSFGGW